MHTRQLGSSGPFLTEIGFGAWAIGGSWIYGWGAVDDNESIRAIHRALDAGINWIDTAAVYGLGHSEEVVGKALRGKRQNVFVATKCGMIWDSERNVRVHLGPASIRNEVEDSLRRLQTDWIDLYQFHWPDSETPLEESWSEMVRIRAEGKVRHIGVCNFDVPLLKRCEVIGSVQSLQPIYNMVERGVEPEILPYCRTRGIGVVAYSPMQSGLLSETFDISRLAPDDWRRKSDKFSAPKIARARNVVEGLRPIAAKYCKTVAQLTVAWVLMDNAVTSAIVGARTVQQVEQNVGAAGCKISKEDMNAIEAVLATER